MDAHESPEPSPAAVPAPPSLGLPWTVPYLTPEIAGCGGVMKRDLEDFIVEEIPAYEACGEGEHVYARIEKRGLTTLDLVSRVGKALGLHRSLIGYAGLKDARAITIQWLSLLGVHEDAVAAIEIPGVRVLTTTRHRNKIRLGHLRGNRFSIRVREVREGALADAQSVLERVRERGLPNWFGAQRFGARRDTHELGRAILLGHPHPFLGHPDRERRRLFLAAAQAQCFNAVLAARLPEFDRVRTGDIAWLHRNGACFRVEDEVQEGPRAANGEISASGPLFGAKCLMPGGAPLATEERVLEELGLSRAAFAARSELDGARRPFRILLRKVELRCSAGNLELSFELPPGSYATTLLREIMKTDADPEAAEPVRA